MTDARRSLIVLAAAFSAVVGVTVLLALLVVGPTPETDLQIDGRVGAVEAAACYLSSRTLGELSPRVTVVEMTLDCPEVEVDGRGVVPLEGTFVMDVTAFPPRGLQ